MAKSSFCNSIVTGTGAIATGATTTTVTDSAVTSDMRVLLTPSGTDGSDFYGRTPYVTTVSNGSFVITHTNAANTPDFTYVAVKA